MPWKETLYERDLSRPFDDATRAAIDDLYRDRKRRLPIPTELSWHPQKPEFTIQSQLVTFVGRFTAEKLVVVAELSLAAKLMATDAHRAAAARFFDEIADDLAL